ncbi:MAG: TonB family protein [Flavobacteriales bacterium]|nr:TonB family protein [Flavobacteriales bacterium]
MENAREKMANGKYKAAVNLLTKIIDYDPHDIPALELRMEANRQLKDDEALCRDINLLRLYLHPDADKYSCPNCEDHIRKAKPTDSTQEKPETQPEKFDNTRSGQGVTTWLDSIARYPEGETALWTFLSRNIRYPARCRENNISGKVFVKFIIDSEGNVCNVSVSRAVDGAPELSWEACKAVQSLGKFQPATMDGKPVPMEMTLQITFQLK